MPGPLRTPKADAKYNVTTEFPNLNLHGAASTGNIGLVKYALSHGQPINSVLDGVSPLHAACAGGHDLVVKLLIAHGADVNAPRLPLRYSNDKHRDASAPIVGGSGATPLHFAAANGHTSVVSTLLFHGAQPDHPDKHGTTPEMLARQGGWLECADLLHDWPLKKDSDLAQAHAEDVSTSSNSLSAINSPQPLERDGSARRCVLVKRSVDHALNSLKSTLNNRSESHLVRSSSVSPVPPSPPPVPVPLGMYTLSSSPNRSSEELSSRHLALHHVYDTASPASPFGSPQERPQSSGHGVDPDDEPAIPPRKLGSKYSFLNLFKRAGESSPGPTTEPSLASAASVSPPPTSSRSSTPNTPLPNSPSSSIPHSRLRTGSESASHPVPDDTEIFNLLQRQAQDRSMSKATVLEEGRKSPDSPPSRSVALRAYNRPSPLPYSPPAAASQPSFATLRFNSATSMGSSPRFRANLGDRVSSRSNSSPASVVKSRSSLSLRIRASGDDSGDITKPYNVQTICKDGQDEVHIDVEGDDEEEYGKPIWRPETIDYRSKPSGLQTDFMRGPCFASSSPSLSPILSPDAVAVPDFPFGLNQPPALDDSGHEDLRTPSSPVHPKDYRDRGDSVSSVSTDSSADPQLTMSGTTATSNGSSTVTTPSPLDPTPPAQRANVNFEKEWSPTVLYSGLPERRAQAPLDLKIRSISAHAQADALVQAEALVQEAERSIFEMANELDGPPSSAGAGRSPLSAKLAIYGERLALERRLKKEEEERTRLSPQSVTGIVGRYEKSAARGSPQHDEERKTSDRQPSLETRSSVKRKEIRRPNTSSGIAADLYPIPRQLSHQRSFATRHNRDFVPPNRHSRSSSESQPSIPLKKPPSLQMLVRSQTPEPKFAKQVANEIIEDVPLTRVSTAPVPETFGGVDASENARHIASASKLSRMGFATADGWQPSSTVSATIPRSGHKAKFGLKSLMQTLKGKP